MQIPLINLTRQYNMIKKEIDSKVLEVLLRGQYIMGTNVYEFEKEFCEYLGVKHAISVANGTDALIIALKALGIGEGDEVITTPYTFFATSESISSIGAIPVFVDVRLDTFNIDFSKIEERITPKTKAIMPVHIFGQPCDMDEINEIAKRYGLHVIEDAAQAIGSKYKKRMIGTLSDIATFSFFPTKNLGCAGDGGIIVTDNDKLATICKALRVHGSGEDGQKAFNILTKTDENIFAGNIIDNGIYNPLKYYNYIVGYNSRLDEIQAAILRVKLKRLDKWNDKRQKNAKYYSENLKDTSLITPYEGKNVKHVYHLYILQSEHREKLAAYLADKGISTGIYYPIPLHLQKAYINLGLKKGDMPNAEYLSCRTFAIPVFAELTYEEMEYIIKHLQVIQQN